MEYGEDTKRVVIEPQRYNFLSKSQRFTAIYPQNYCCYWTTKIQFSKQITTEYDTRIMYGKLLLNHKDTIF